jgi:hypothetical protein
VAARRSISRADCLTGLTIRQTPFVSDDILICSAKGCRNPASWALRWNNPKLHPEDRRKTWLACADHREWLGGFLSARGFLREVDPV